VENQDKIKEVFSEKLGNFEATVRSGLWEGIASQIPVAPSTVAGSAAWSIATKVILGLVSVIVVGTLVYVLIDINGEKKENELITTQKTQDVLEKQKIESLSLVADDAASSQKEDEVTQAQNGELANEEVIVGVGEVISDVDRSSVRSVNSDREVRMNTINNQKPAELPLKILEGKGISNIRKDDVLVESPNVKPVKKDVKREEEVPVSTIEVGSTTSNHLASATEITFLPNVITPNGDYVNDEFRIEFRGRLLDFNLVVMDRQNNMIYKSNDPSAVWNCSMMNGELAPSGNYYYIITAKDELGNSINKYMPLSVNP
jgi:gliding motility-associated-like protein